MVGFPTVAELTDQLRSLLVCLSEVQRHMDFYGRSTQMGGAEAQIREEIAQMKTRLAQTLLREYLITNKIEG